MDVALNPPKVESNNEAWGYKAARGLRADGRSCASEIRPVQCELGVIGNADGSCRFRLGLTSVSAAVYSPVESTMLRKTLESRSYVEIIVRPLKRSGQQRANYIEACLNGPIKDIFKAELFPRTTTVVAVQVESEDGGELACAVNAVMGAFIDAALPCNFTCFAVSLAQLKTSRGETVFCDPTIDETQAWLSTDLLTGYCCVAVDSITGAVCQIVPELLPARLLTGAGLNVDEQLGVLEDNALNRAPSTGGFDIATVALACCERIRDIFKFVFTQRLEALSTALQANVLCSSSSSST